MRVLNNIRLTDNQGRVLTKIIAAPTPQVAGATISQGQNFVAARNELMALKLITMVNGAAEITADGMTVAAQENLIDDLGELTPRGEELAFTGADGEPDNDTTGSTPKDDQGTFPMESHRVGRLLKELYTQTLFKK